VRLRLVTWNIHRCIGADRVESPDRCARVLRDIGADVVLLQEVESSPGGVRDVLAYFGRETGYEVVAGPTVVAGNIHYGNALLSGLPSLAVRHHDISVAGREPRGVLDVDLGCDGGSLQVIATHLGLRPAERRAQVEALVPLFRETERDLVVLAGDFNEWFLWGRPLRRLHRLFPDTPHRRSWPARWPLFALDRIWVNPRPALVNLQVHRSKLSRVASDHLPLVADIRL